MPTEEQQQAFGRALRKLMDSHHHTQRQFGEAIGELVRGADKPYAQSTVRDWIEKAAPAPEIVFEMEGYLLVPPGSLSQHLGYLPTTARSITTVQQALMADTSIDESGRDICLLIYALFAGQPLVDATLSQWTRWDLERIVGEAKRSAELDPQNAMEFDEKGRLVGGFEVAPYRVLKVAVREWAEVPNLPTPPALVAAVRAGYEEAVEHGWEPATTDWGDLLRQCIGDEQFALAAEGGMLEYQAVKEDVRPTDVAVEPEGT